MPPSLSPWQPVPGRPSIDHALLLTPPSITTCNTLLLAGGERALIVDPGGVAEQGATLAAALRDRGVRRVTVLLTHGHRDHLAALEGIDLPLELAAHQACADSLETGDTERTLAWFNGGPFRPHAVDQQLFTEEGDVQAVAFGPLGAEVMALPGHSPCSIAVRVGDILCMGDLPFATTPGLIGLTGFDATTLATSLRRMIALLEANPGLSCLPGHGPMVPATKMAEHLRAQLGRVPEFREVAAMDPARLALLRQLSVDVLEEAYLHCALLSGSLMSTAFHLEEMGEADRAQTVSESVDHDALERALDSVRRMSEAVERGQRLESELLLKAAGTMDQLSGLLSAGGPAGRPAMIAARAARLLRLFLSKAIGLAVREGWEPVDLGTLVSDMAAAFPALDGQALLDAADDPDAFADTLAERLASLSAMDAVGFAITPPANPIVVEMDRQLLLDCLSIIVEALATSAKSPRIAIAAEADGKRAALTITSAANATEALGERRLRMINHFLTGQNARVAGDGQSVVFDLPLATPV